MPPPSPCRARRGIRRPRPPLSGLLLPFLLSPFPFLFSPPSSAAPADPPLDRFGGLTALSASKSAAKPFFRVEKIADRYWFVTPENHAFWSLGPCVVQWQDGWGGRCPALSDFFPNPFANRAKYGDDPAAWRKATHTRFRDLGWNTEAAWGVGDFGEIPECVRVLFISGAARGRGARTLGPKDAIHTTFVDVFDPAFEAAAEDAAKQLAAVKDSPWVIGAFPDNEIHWEGLEKKPDGARALVDDFIAWDADAPGKKAWCDLLQKKYASIAALNQAWGTTFAGWDALAAATQVPDNPAHPALLADKLDFMREICDRYYRVTTGAMRKNDPNHLVFSARFALWGGAFEKEGRQVAFHEAMWEAAGKHCDVIAVNCYHDPAWLEREHRYFSRVFAKTRKPMCITEWAVVARDSHFETTNGWVDTQTERAQGYAARLRAYLDLAVADDPNGGGKAFFCLGAHWFQLYDEPPLGRTDGEHVNFGCYTAQDEPFRTFLGPVSTFNRQIPAHLVKAEPIAVLPPPETAPVPPPAPDGTPGVSWKPIGGATGYTVIASPLPASPGDGMSLEADAVQDPPWTLDPALPQGAWHLSVAGADGPRGVGFFSKPVTVELGAPGMPGPLRPYFKFENLRLWKNRDGDGPGLAVGFPEDRPKFAKEGKRCARVVFTPLSLDRTTNKKNEAKAAIAWRWAGPPLRMKDRRHVEFAVRPAPVCTFPPDRPAQVGPAGGKLYPSTRFVKLRLADATSGKELVHPVDPDGTLKVEEWHRIKVDLTPAKFDRIDTIEWFIECSDPQAPWDQRVTIWVDDFTAVEAE